MPMVVHDIIISFANGVKRILGDDLKKIILYGSYARGDYSENSDIAFDFLMDYGVDISVVIKNENQFNYWLGALPFYDNVQREGMVLNG